MNVRLYLNEDAFRHSLVEALRSRGVDVLTPLEAGMLETSDKDQLAYASANGRSLYTFNVGDFCRLHTEWITAEREHAGIIVARQTQLSIGDQMRRLLNLIATKSAEDMRNQLEFLSAWD